MKLHLDFMLPCLSDFSKHVQVVVAVDFCVGGGGGGTTFCLAQLKHVYALHNLHDISQDWLRFVRSWVWAQFGDHQVELLP